MIMEQSHGEIDIEMLGVLLLYFFTVVPDIGRFLDDDGIAFLAECPTDFGNFARTMA